MILDLFAGPGGWSEGLRLLGASDVGVEMDRDACLTRAAAGHETIRGDVQRLPLRLDQLAGLIASPPCTDFSVAGKMAGRAGDTGRLIDTVPPLVADWLPRWIACEQVPPCLPIWHEHAAYYRALGYRTWVGVLNAANYGVPQTRKRAFLLASLDVQPTQPPATHAKQPSMLHAPWVSMADALGWCEPERKVRTRGDRKTPGGNVFGAEHASWTLTEKARSWVLDRRCTSDGKPVPVVESDRPAPSLTVSAGAKSQWVLRPSGYTNGVRDEVPAGRIAPTLTSAGTRTWQKGSTLLTVQDALILQSFPPDYPVQGSRSSQFRQVGNAVPPLLAARVLEQLL